MPVSRLIGRARRFFDFCTGRTQASKDAFPIFRTRDAHGDLPRDVRHERRGVFGKPVQLGSGLIDPARGPENGRQDHVVHRIVIEVRHSRPEFRSSEVPSMNAQSAMPASK